MSVPQPWARHYQLPWENRAAEHNLPLWLRVACLAYGRHEANGHATFQRGALSWILGTPPKDGQPFQRVARQTIQTAIATAVRNGWLAEGSCSECLIVPGHAIAGGLGNEHKVCAVHERKNAAKRASRTVLQVVS